MNSTPQPLSTPSLAIVICRRVHGYIKDNGLSPDMVSFIRMSVAKKSWEKITTNSSLIAEFLGIPFLDEPDVERTNLRTEVGLCRFVWGVDHVLALWGGSPEFEAFLEAAYRTKRHLRLYTVKQNGSVKYESIAVK